MENKALQRSHKKKSKPIKPLVDFTLRTLKIKMLYCLGDAYCAIWDIFKGTAPNKVERGQARARAMEALSTAMRGCKGLMLEMEKRNGN